MIKYDLQFFFFIQREIDPSVSVTPVEETRREDNLTVYF